jgi:hypothetical protein
MIMKKELEKEWISKWNPFLVCSRTPQTKNDGWMDK